MSAENPLDDVKEGLVVKPGDMLLLSFGRKIYEQEQHEIIERLRKILPGVNVVIFPEVDQMALIPRRPPTDGRVEYEI